MAGLNGEYRHKLDAKGRLSLPSSIRKLLTEETQMVVVPDARNEFLSVYTNEAFDVWIDTLFEKRGGFDRLHIFAVFPVFGFGHVGKPCHDLGNLLPLVLARYSESAQVFPYQRDHITL